MCSLSKGSASQINKTKMFMSWNGYYSYTNDSIIKWQKKINNKQVEAAKKMIKRKLSVLSYHISVI